MAQETQAYKRSFSGSVGSGVGSLFNGGGKTYYILEHKVSSQYHKAGETQEIIVDQIELGRDAKCQVRFDESFSTVSRRHAAIVRDGQNWKLVQLSTTNTTFLNGKPVTKEWYLQNGDEIQLSVNGPKLGFIVPTGNKSTVGSIGLSRRLSLFRQQALRPYKTAMAVMSAILVLAIGGGVGVNIYQGKQFAADRADMDKRFREQQAVMDTLRTVNKDLTHQIKVIKTQTRRNTEDNVIINPGTIDNDKIKQCMADVYYIRLHKIVLSLNGESVEVDFQISGTGFMLADGHFVTARHVAEPWYYFVSGGEVNEKLLIINKVVEQGGSAVGYFTAYSSTGKQFNFTSSEMRVDRSQDKVGEHEGNRYRMAVPCNTDWAYMNMNNGNGKLVADAALSNTLPLQAELTILGYPFSIGAHSQNDITPILAKAIVARKGLENGRILTTNTTFESGNSGGPVFANKSGKLVVVGIVSAGIGNSTGFIVPISSIYNN